MPHHHARAVAVRARHLLGPDEPTNLPEGAEVRVALVDGDELDDEERARLHEALDAGIAAARVGDHVDADEYIRELLARP